MLETAFNDLAERVFARVGEALDDSGADVDWVLNEGVMEIECAGGKLILSRHTPNRELWLAAKSGGYHYRAEGGEWRDTRGGENLRAMLERALREQAGEVIEVPELPAQ
jgi:CyaY protein